MKETLSVDQIISEQTAKMKITAKIAGLMLINCRACSPQRSSEVWRISSVEVIQEQLILNLVWGTDTARVPLCGIRVNKEEETRSHLAQLLANAPRGEIVVFQAGAKSEVFIPQRGTNEELFLSHELVKAGLGRTVNEGCPNQ